MPPSLVHRRVEVKSLLHWTRTAWGGDRPDWTGAEDSELIEALVDGRDEALDEIVARYGDRIRSYLGHLLGDAWAEDVTQDVFVRVYQKAKDYDSRYAFSVWCFRLARNMALDLLRRERLQRETMDRFERTGHDEGFTNTRPPPSPLEVVEAREFRVAFEAAMRTLPESFRTVFHLREIEQLSHAEIGAITGLGVKTVSTRLHRARHRLRVELATYLADEEEGKEEGSS